MTFKRVSLILFLAGMLVHPQQMLSVSIVYNLRVAQTTRNALFSTAGLGNSIFAATVINQHRKTRDDIEQNIIAGLGTYIYTKPNFYAKVDLAAGNVHSAKDDVHFSRTQLDDIVFTSGYSHAFSERVKASISGIVGVPTHDDLGLQGIQLGTGHYGLGAQLDGLYVYEAWDVRHSLVSAARYIKFFPRTVNVTTFDIMQRFKVDIGNLADLFFAHNTLFGANRIEVGYNPTFAFGASTYPQIAEVDERSKFIRSSFFGTYMRGFLIKETINAIIFGMSAGFDHTPKKYGFKYLFSVWMSWGVNF